MAFRCWQMGLHIQQDNVFIVALQRTRSGWGLRRWWQLPLPPSAQQDDAALLELLKPWRRELPWQHAVRVAFPANRTLQKNLPLASMTLRDAEQMQWIASAMSQQLEMNADALCFDYHLAESAACWNVTAAQQGDVARLQHLAKTLRLQVTSITPDACALQALVTQSEVQDAVLVWPDHQQWLWASREGWGHCAFHDARSLTQLADWLSINPQRLVRCSALAAGERCFDPWSAVVQKHPPLPVNGDDFAVALALAMGGAA